MIDLVKKAMFTGLGVMSLTKEKVEEIAKDFVEKGQLSEQEGRTLVKEMLEKSEESKNEIKKQIDTAVKAALSQMDIASKTDLEAVRTEIEQLRNALNKEQGS